MSTELERRALRLLARRERTRAELARKLAPHCDSSPELQALVENLASRGLLSEQRYAESRAHRLSQKFGAVRIRGELMAKGVAADTAAQLAADLGKSDCARAISILRRKYNTAATSPRERARRMRFLYARGFSAEVIRAALRASSDDTE